MMILHILEQYDRAWDVVVHAHPDIDGDEPIELVFAARGEPSAKYAAPVSRLALDQIGAGGEGWLDAVLTTLLDDAIRENRRPTGLVQRTSYVRMGTRTRTALDIMIEQGLHALPVLADDRSCAGIVLRSGFERGCIMMHHLVDCAVVEHLKRDVELVLEEGAREPPRYPRRPRVVLGADGRPAFVHLGG